MFDKFNLKNKIMVNCKILFVIALISAVTAFGQSPSPSPESEETVVNGYKLTSTVELGVRGLDVDGSINKFRSDLNYRNGFRVFQSSFMMENKEGRRRFIDKLLINSSGWGADRSGFTRVSAESTGLYTFSANFRRMAYFNSLTNHALNQHNFNTNRDIGDFDLSVYPWGDKFKLNFGASYDASNGPGTWTARAYRDDFPVSVNNQTNANDFRVGFDGEVLGFNLGLTQGYRRFTDKTQYFLEAPTIGNTTTDPATFATFLRQFPTVGNSYFTMFNAQRTFAKRLDFTARIIYSQTRTRSSMIEEITGRDNNNNRVDLDRFEISGDAVRPQMRGDLGLTFFVTKDIKLSNTFSFDRFGIDGGENLFETLIRRNAAGTPLPTSITRSAAYRVTDFRRYINTTEADFQIKNWVGFHIGYRYTNRRVELFGYNQTLTSAPSPTNPLFITEEEDNQTNALIAGMKIKPTKFWVVFWDMEWGSADNVFTRLENYKYTNFRVRSRWTFDKFNVNLSAITRDNRNPSRSDTNPAIGFGADVNSRIYTGSVDWTPISRLNFSSGYTYTHISSQASIIVPLNAGRLQGVSQYFVRDHSFYFDLSAQVNKRFSFFGSYRISKDYGQRDGLTAILPNLISSYPMEYQTPEFRAAFRLTKNIDWNIGYQYYHYMERFAPVQNYVAHLPYTSLTIYLGRPDR